MKRFFLIIFFFLYSFSTILSAQQIESTSAVAHKKVKYLYQKQIFYSPLKEVFQFEKKYGWFSPNRPLVSRVTDQEQDVKIVCDLLQRLSLDQGAFLQKYLSVGEVLTKVLAYRNLSLGQEIMIPIQQGNQLVPVKYKVDKVFNLWKEMPAFGFVPLDHPKAPSLLLFRGTDASLRRRGSWSSLVSDLDVAGPGYSVFKRARGDIHDWLKKVKDMHHPACAMGFSLGGILACYTAIYEHDLLSQKAEQSCIAFNPPGLGKKLLLEWNKIEKDQPHMRVFITKNDFVSKTGYFFGEIYFLSPRERMRPLKAHVGLISAIPDVKIVPYVQRVNLKKIITRAVSFFNKKHE